MAKEGRGKVIRESVFYEKVNFSFTGSSLPRT